MRISWRRGGDDMRDIGRNIRCVRVRRGLTQEELAERLHVSRQTVSNYETGRSRPDVDMLLLAAEKLEVDVQVLLYGEPVQTQRRREVYLLLAEGAALLALGVGLRLCDRWARRLLMRGFAGGPLYRCSGLLVFAGVGAAPGLRDLSGGEAAEIWMGASSAAGGGCLSRRLGGFRASCSGGSCLADRICASPNSRGFP